MQEYESAESCVDRVLQMEPNNYQAKQLKALAVKKIRRGELTHVPNYVRYSYSVRILYCDTLVVCCTVDVVHVVCHGTW